VTFLDSAHVVKRIEDEAGEVRERHLDCGCTIPHEYNRGLASPTTELVNQRYPPLLKEKIGIGGYETASSPSPCATPGLSPSVTGLDMLVNGGVS
jgi:hypothetical protein